jgi:hypothetical protein
MQGDQATVVGGAIDYVKQLEQQLVALQAAAGARRGSSVVSDDGVFLVSPQYASYSGSRGGGGLGVDVEATGAVGGHVRVRVAGRRWWPGRLVRAVAALEGLRLAVLHLAVTSVGRDAVVCCFNLKVSQVSRRFLYLLSCSRMHACPRRLFLPRTCIPPGAYKRKAYCTACGFFPTAVAVHGSRRLEPILLGRLELKCSNKAK